MIAIGCDHGGVEFKDFVVGFLRAKGVEVRNFGTHGQESLDYPHLGPEVRYESPWVKPK
jgi:ribose 5-phosphate isomerase RpiB